MSPFSVFKHSHKHARMVITDLASLRHVNLTGHIHPAPGLRPSALGPRQEPEELGVTQDSISSSPRAPATVTSAAGRVECPVTNQRLLLWMKAAGTTRSKMCAKPPLTYGPGAVQT